MRRPTRTVAVVVPVSARPSFNADEELSLKHLCHYLGRYDKYFVVPAGSPVRRDGFRTVCFPRRFFGSAAAHNPLLFSRKFYRTFEEYEYILMHHLDSLVFSDELEQWCQADLDYIGAPWLPCPDTPWVKELRVGNGGFALMRVSTVLQVLQNRYRQEPSRYVSDLLARHAAPMQPLFALLEAVNERAPGRSGIERWLKRWRVARHPAEYGRNNDTFWSLHAARYVTTFKVATVEEGLRFAFEAAPRTCFELNQGRLPFGCHAWAKFDRAFWEPYLLPAAGLVAHGRTP